MKLLSKLTKLINRIPRRLLIVVLLILVSSGIFLFSRPGPEVVVQFTTVKKGDLKQTISSSGVLTGKDSVHLKFTSLGKLASINVRVGDKVFAGQILASLDSQKQSIEERIAQNNLRDKQTTLEKILDDIYLFQYGNGGFGNVGSPNETMTQKASRTSAEVSKDNAFNQAKLAQRAFEDTVLISPINGIVTQSPFFPGQFVSAADPIVQVVDNTEIYFEAEVDEVDIGKISLDQEAQISLNSYPDQTFNGQVTKIFPTTKTTSSGATVVIVRVKLENVPLFISGVNGQAEIITKQSKNVLIIPTESLKDEDKVIIKEGEDFKEVQVKTGLRSEAAVEITEGLTDGQQIVKNPFSIQVASKGLLQRLLRRS